MKKYTPGPWKSALAFVSNEPNRYVITNGKWGAPNIAQVYDEGDAHLIAAAPELLAVLKLISKFAKTGQPLHWGALITDSDEETAAETVLTVIAKAEGKKQ